MQRTILIASDTWEPQVNGVVRTLKKTIEVLERWNWRVEIIDPYQFHPFKVPFFDGVELTLALNRARVGRLIRAANADAIHIASEGPIGVAVRRYCLKHGIPYTTWHHTDYPETLGRVLPLIDKIGAPRWAIYPYMRWFHRHSSALMVNTDRMRRKLESNGFGIPMKVWPGGVDTNLFVPRPKSPRRRKQAVYIGRVAGEKGIEKFLECQGDYDKVVVGDGAARRELQARYPEVEFRGVLRGEALAQAYADADVFVFPSRTDTFGLVLIEALSCGVPVAAYPVQGPIDIIDRDGVGCLSENLSEAIDVALENPNPQRCRELALDYSWENSAKKFLRNLAWLNPSAAPVEVPTEPERRAA